MERFVAVFIKRNDPNGRQGRLGSEGFLGCSCHAPQQDSKVADVLLGIGQLGNTWKAAVENLELLRPDKAISVAELGQLRHLEALASPARGRAVRISSALAAAGIRGPGEDDGDRAQGGPYEPVPAADR